MTTSFQRLRFFIFSAALAWVASPGISAEPALRPGDLVAVIGDSITEQKLYSIYIEQYLLLCQPAENLMAMQFGWSGERASRLVPRVNNDVLTFKPTVVTTCYGMNDGNYRPVEPSTLDAYRQPMTEAVRKLKAGGVRVIVVGSPGVVDPKSFNRPGANADAYNQTLAALRDVAREVAAAEGVLFADVHAVMMDAMTKAKAARGADYLIAPDGVHPFGNGHLAMAYAFLKALGVNGDIGTLTVDYAAGTATGSPGQRVTDYVAGQLSVESTRYPYCFAGKEDGTDTRAMSAFIPFNDELNRYLLVVKNAPARASVTWGSASKEFTSAQLAAGINLAAEFPDNPFVEPFAAATKVMQVQQVSETAGIKNMLNSIGRWRNEMPEGAPHYDALEKLVVTKSEATRSASAAAVKPVSHRLTIKPVS